MGAVIVAGLSSCQKDKSAPSSTNLANKSVSATKYTTPSGTYTDMVLVSQNPDVYACTWHGIHIQATGSIVYNIAQYPTLVNGVPVDCTNVSSTDLNTNSSATSAAFTVTAAVSSFSNSAAFDADLNNYFSALGTWEDAGMTGAAPEIGTYVKSSYTTSSGITTYTGKLIRVLTGTHLAVADLGYPVPTPTVPAQNALLPSAFMVVDSTNLSIGYEIHGTNGNISSYKTFTKVGTTWTGGSTTSGVANGTFTSSNYVYHCIGTIIKSDGSTQNFDMSYNPN